MTRLLLLVILWHHIPPSEERGHGGWACQVTLEVLWREYLFPGKRSRGQVQMPRRSPGAASWVQAGGSALWEPAKLGLDHCQLPALPQDGRLNHSAPLPRPEPHVVFVNNKLVKNEGGGGDMENSFMTHWDDGGDLLCCPCSNTPHWGFLTPKME